MEIPAKRVQIECILDFHLIANRRLQQSNSTRVRVMEIPAKRVLIECIFDFYFFVNQCTFNFISIANRMRIQYL